MSASITRTYPFINGAQPRIITCVRSIFLIEFGRWRKSGSACRAIPEPESADFVGSGFQPAAGLPPGVPGRHERRSSVRKLKR
jgi:hypothetical protein